jgi:ribonuclease-3
MTPPPFSIDPVKSTFMNPIEERIQYKFRNGLLLAEALTHPSISLERKDYPFDNQRLEFLGDAVVQLAVTEHLFRMFPGSSEGQMTKLRTRIVSRSALKERASALGLGDFIMMGRGEEASGGRERASTLADVFESLVGAIYLDGGFDSARLFILRQMDILFQEIAEKPEEINPKGYLQEILQAIEPSAPDYRIVSQSGPEHSKVFICSVVWNSIDLGQGCGFSKKEAQVAAAQDALTHRRWEQEWKAAARPRRSTKK